MNQYHGEKSMIIFSSIENPPIIPLYFILFSYWSIKRVLTFTLAWAKFKTSPSSNQNKKRLARGLSKMFVKKKKKRKKKSRRSMRILQV